MHSDVVRIPLSRGYWTTVDAADWPELALYNWHASVDGNGFVYAVTSIYDPGTQKSKQVRLHRFLCKPTGRQVVDHKDRDTLNNRRANLRVATKVQNLANQVRKPHESKRSRYKGVCKQDHLKHKPWTAQIRIDKKLKHLGCFAEEIDAAKAYDTAALEVFGDFALLNFGDEHCTAT